jgi:ankyrin repeat protein
MDAVERDELTAAGVSTAVASGVDVNVHRCGVFALHRTVETARDRSGSDGLHTAAALLAVGADPNIKDTSGATAVWWAAYRGTAEMLQLLIDGGGSVNEADGCSRSPLVALVCMNTDDATDRLAVLLSRPELDLDVTYRGKPVELLLVPNPNQDCPAAITAEACIHRSHC